MRRQPPAGLPVRPHPARAGRADAGAVENPTKPVRLHRPGRLQGARKVRRRKQEDVEGAAEGGLTIFTIMTCNTWFQTSERFSHCVRVPAAQGRGKILKRNPCQGKHRELGNVS